jgi:hypothetical protein
MASNSFGGFGGSVRVTHTMKECPIKLTPPWGWNYCKTSALYHGGGGVIIVFLASLIGPMWWAIGVGICLAIICALLNYWIDSSVEGRREYPRRRASRSGNTARAAAYDAERGG